MAKEKQKFGEGVFDSEPEESVITVSDPSEDQEPEKIVLTEREIAIAEGRNPDEVDNARKAHGKEQAEEQAKGEEGEAEEQAEEDETEVLSEPKDSFTDSDYRLAKMYGLTQDDLKKFDSPKSLHAAIDILDARQGKDAGDADGSAQSEGDANEDGGAVSELLGFEKTDPEKVRKQFEAVDDDGDRIYDEETANFAIGMAEQNRKLQDVVERLLQGSSESAMKAHEAQAEKNRKILNDQLDRLPELYGSSMKDGKPSELDSLRTKLRQEVADHVQTYYEGLVSRGLEIPPLEKMIEVSIKAVHAEKLAEAKKRKSDLQDQSKSRRSPGTKVKPAKRAVPEGADPYDPSIIASDPELVDFFDNAQFENGVGR